MLTTSIYSDSIVEEIECRPFDFSDSIDEETELLLAEFGL